MCFVIFTATTATFKVKYLIIIGLSGGSRGGSRVAVEAFFGQKPHFFTYFSSKYEQFSFIFYVKIMLI